MSVFIDSTVYLFSALWRDTSYMISSDTKCQRSQLAMPHSNLHRINSGIYGSTRWCRCQSSPERLLLFPRPH